MSKRSISPMMVVHADGTESPVYQESFMLVNVEHDLNHIYFTGHDDYVITCTWNPEVKDIDYMVVDLRDHDAEVPELVVAAAKAAIDKLVAVVDKEAQRKVNLAAAPKILADAIHAMDLAADWEIDGDGLGASVRLGDQIAIVGTYDGSAWNALSYNVFHPKQDHWSLDTSRLSDALEGAEEWLYKVLSTE